MNPLDASKCCQGVPGLSKGQSGPHSPRYSCLYIMRIYDFKQSSDVGYCIMSKVMLCESMLLSQAALKL
jgi:hypothetical protein